MTVANRIHSKRAMADLRREGFQGLVLLREPREEFPGQGFKPVLKDERAVGMPDEIHATLIPHEPETTLRKELLQENSQEEEERSGRDPRQPGIARDPQRAREMRS